ncbi:porin [Dethiosulfatarculus sandiegensis]|uniref:Porin domain-containing protein n=1 Tax=Dethiosulfatarculus sandiegensis TaxID=1429043 RepID=A0A0D2GN75_9BACT|nr:porin [Dethiosulfatarculus sandiegensis]KIX16082.1 hypothetical protein X474_00995 [Dethiosulfatarculus sandiegensis]
MKKFFVLALALAALVAMSAPVMAAEAPAPSIVLGARVNQTFGYQNKSKELTTNGQDDITKSFVDLQGNSYFRAKFTSADKKVGVHTEIGLKSTVGMRHVYGWYKMGNCKFLAGNTDNWAGAPYWNYHKANAAPGGDLLGWGKMWAPRRPQVQLTWSSGNFGLQFALEKAAEVDVPFADVYNKIPRATLGFQFKTASFSTTPSVNFARYDWEGGPIGIDENVEAWAFILPVQVNAGAFKVIAELHYASNPGVGWSGYSADLGPQLKDDGSFEATTNYGGYVDASYKVGALRIALGFGYEHFANDAWKDYGFKEDSFSRQLFYLSLPYTVHKNFIMYPEFNYLNHGDSPVDGDDQGNEWVLGILFRFIF